MAPSPKTLILGLLLPVLLPALLPGWAARAAEPVNLIDNGGFEDGLLGWTAAAGQSLVSGPAAAHSGKACLGGEVTGPSQALILRRSVRVRAGNRYELHVWARATNRAKLVVFGVQPGAKMRQMIATYKNVPRRWTRYVVALPVRQDGSFELQIIAPSSHAAPVGKMWLDDVALYETKMPPITPVSKGEGFNDEPAMAAASDGTVYVAYNSFREGHDSLQIARFRSQSGGFQPAGAWQALGGKGTYILGVRAVPAGENVVVVYAAEVDKNWDVFAVPCGPDGPQRPVAVTSHAGGDVKPAAAWHDGRLWVAWESNRNGRRQVFAASVRDGDVSKPVALGRAEASCYGPSLAVLDSGEVCIAWHGLVDNSYDVYLRRKPAGGGWGTETRLTRAPSVDRHPVLFARGDELWLVYENAQTEKYNIGRTNRRRLIVAKVTPQGLLAPKHGPGSSPLAARCEGPAAGFDDNGRLWLAFRKPRLPRSGWDVFLISFDDGRWQHPMPVSIMKGMDRPPGLVLAGGRAIVAFQADDMPNSWSDLDRTLQATSNVFLAGVDLGPASSNAMPLTPLAESEEPFEPAQLHVLRGEDTPTPTITYQGQTLKLFFGDLHEHTAVSVCNRLGDQSIDESYQHMRDLAHHDFACATDHGYNINPYLWSYTAKLARTNEDPGRFLTFLAEEWTSTFEEYSEKHPYGFYGHRNLIFADPYFPRWFNARNRQTPAQVWEELRKLNANFVQIPHQIADTGNVPTDWDYTDQRAQPVAEIFQTRGSYEYQGAPRMAARATPKPGYFLQDAWARGIVIGVIASPDHGGGYGKACVFAPELTREAILDGLRARRCYGTTAAKIFLDVRVDGHLMGEKLDAPAAESVTVEILARCPGDIQRIEVCRNNRFIYTTSPKGRQAKLTFIDRQPLPGRSYYYVRVLQQDEEIAWSSPVWFGAK